MSKKLLLSTCGVLALFNTACTHQEAAMIGTAIGRPVGYPLGVAVVAVEEVFGTAGDISKASVRHSNKSNANRHYQDNSRLNNHSSSKATSYNNNTKYYETKLVIKSKGPMAIENVYFKDSSDVTEFWQ